MKPLNSTLLGRVLIRMVCLWGGVILIAWLFTGTPLKHSPGPIQAAVVSALLFGCWIAALFFGQKPPDSTDEG